MDVLSLGHQFIQCGIILATLMLILSAVITRTVCYFLLKAGTITRRRNYEMLGNIKFFYIIFIHTLTKPNCLLGCF